MADPFIPAPEDFAFHREVRGAVGTTGLGEELASLLKGGEILLLHGRLGAGKTCFTQGLCRGLEVTQEVVSPTFTLVNTYTGRLTVHHLDFYRIEPDADLADIGVPDILDQVDDGTAVAVVEWPEIFRPELGGGLPYLEMLATGGKETDDRIWHLRGRPTVPVAWANVFTGASPQPPTGA
mgnify:CR=1 FL=1